MDPRLQALLKQLLRKAHTTVLPEPLEEKMVMDLYIQLEQKLDSAILESLDPNARIDYQNLVQSQVPQEQLAVFLNEKSPNLQETLRKVIADFEEDYISVIQWQK